MNNESLPATRPSRLGQLFSVVRKEIIDASRDRRSVIVALLTALFAPLLTTLLLSEVVASISDEKALEVSVKNGEAAPELLRYLKEHRAVLETFTGTTAEAEAQVRDRNPAFVLIVDPDYGEDLARGLPARVELIYDSSRTDVRGLTRRLQGLIQQYSSGLAAMRLLARGLDPRVVQPLRLEARDVATEAERSTAVFGMLPMILILIIFVCTFNVAVDVTAGERERGSLEPLLIVPIERGTLVLGKWLATVVFGVGGMVLGVVALASALRLFSFDAVGFQPAVGTAQALQLFVLLLPLTLLLPALEILLAVFANTFKEAQTYVSLLALTLYAPTFVTMFQKVEPEGNVLFVPILAHQTLAYDLISGGTPNAAALLTPAVVPVALTMLLLVVTTRVVQTERIIFGK